MITEKYFLLLHCGNTLINLQHTGVFWVDLGGRDTGCPSAMADLVVQFMEVTGADHAEAVSLLEVLTALHPNNGVVILEMSCICTHQQAADDNLDNAIALFFAKNDGPSSAPANNLDALAGYAVTSNRMCVPYTPARTQDSR